MALQKEEEHSMNDAKFPLPRKLWQAAFLLNLGPEVAGLLITRDVGVIMLFVVFSLCITLLAYLMQFLIQGRRGL